MTNTNNTLTPDEIAERITIGMRLVYDLFNEMNSFFHLVAEGLRVSGLGIRPFTSSGVRLPRVRAGRTFADRFVSTDMGLLAEISPAADDVDDEEADEEGEDLNEDEELGEDEEVLDQAELRISPDSQYLMIRAILLDPTQAMDKFRPEVVAGKLSSITRRRSGKKARAKEKAAVEREFEMKGSALKKFTRKLKPETKAKTDLSCRISPWEWSAKITAVEHLPLAEVDSEQKVAEFVERLLKMAEA
jgi:hypothetical protein